MRWPAGKACSDVSDLCVSHRLWHLNECGCGRYESLSVRGKYGPAEVEHEHGVKRNIVWRWLHNAIRLADRQCLMVLTHCEVVSTKFAIGRPSHEAIVNATYTKFGLNVPKAIIFPSVQLQAPMFMHSPVMHCRVGSMQGLTPFETQ